MSKSNISPSVEEIPTPEQQQSNSGKISLQSSVIQPSASIKADASHNKDADAEPLSNLQLTKQLKELDEKVLDDYIWQENHTLNKVALLRVETNLAIKALKKENTALKEQNSMIVTAFNSLQAKLQKILRFKDKELRPRLIEPQEKQSEEQNQKLEPSFREMILRNRCKKRSRSSSSDNDSSHSRSRQKNPRRQPQQKYSLLATPVASKCQCVCSNQKGNTKEEGKMDAPKKC